MNTAADLPNEAASEPVVIERTQDWVVKAVIGLNLCPFAKAEHVHGRIRYEVSHATSREELLQNLEHSIRFLWSQVSEQLETTLLIHPWVLGDFFDYNDFLADADDLIENLGLTGELQVASFHPQYQFADAGVDDITNFSNRSPYPTLHLLREASIARAVEAFPDAADIYERNMAVLRQLGLDGWKKLWV
jgi:uncharacterized protein